MGTTERTISYQEHYIQVVFYQNFIKDKEKEIQDLKKQLQFTLEAKDVLEAKLEVEQMNSNKYNE
jgi:hypothetical protein